MGFNKMNYNNDQELQTIITQIIQDKESIHGKKSYVYKNTVVYIESSTTGGISPSIHIQNKKYRVSTDPSTPELNEYIKAKL